MYVKFFHTQFPTDTFKNFLINMTLSLSYVYMDIWVNDSFLPHLKEHLQFKTFLTISSNQA